MTTVLGIDISLTHTALAVVKSDSLILKSELIRSKPCGDTYKDEIIRMKDICDRIFETLERTFGIDGKPDLVMIEGMAFMARNTTALVQIAGLSYLIRLELVKRDWPFVIVAPLTLKKFIIGKGRADKNLMMMTVLRDYGFESLDDNICDSYSLAVCGLALLDRQIHKLGEPQKEVIKLLKKQLCQKTKEKK